MTDRRTGTVVKWSAATLALLVVSVPVAWLLVHGLSHPTEPRWTEADLPASPPDADNGWTEIGSSVSAVDLPALDRLLDPETALEDRLASYDRAAGSLAIEARQHASEIERLRRAYERPRFADGCPLDPTGPGCAWLATLAAERLVVLDAFRQLHDQDARGALATAAMLVRAHVDLAATARSLVATRVAAVCLAHAFVLAEVLTGLADRAGLDRSTWAASGRSIRESATRHVEHPLDPARTVIAEYVWARAALRAFVGTPGGPRGGRPTSAPRPRGSTSTTSSSTTTRRVRARPHQRRPTRPMTSPGGRTTRAAR